MKSGTYKRGKHYMRGFAACQSPTGYSLLGGAEHERERYVHRPARRSGESPPGDEGLDAARDLGVAERVLLDVDAGYGAGLSDGPVDHHLAAQVRRPLERALVAVLDSAQAALHFFRDHRRIELTIDSRRLGLDDARHALL